MGSNPDNQLDQFDAGSVDEEIFSDQQWAGLQRVQQMDLSPGEIVGKCRVVRELGSGGMGTVYLCRHTRLDIDVALKVLPPAIARERPEVARRFIREAQLAARIRHPNVVLVMDADFDERTGLYYIIFEYVSGGSLADLLDTRRMTVGEAVSVTHDIAQALVVAAEHGIVHRDVKPDNIMLDERGTAKLADLGLARQAVAELRTRVTQDGAAIGTPSYMSPDQIKDALSADAQDDIYSLGATFYECLTSSPPFPSTTAVNALSNALFSPTPDPAIKNPEVPASVSQICQKMMAKVKRDRFKSAAEVVKVLASESALVAPDVGAPNSRDSLRRSAEAAREKSIVLNNAALQEAVRRTPAYSAPGWWMTYQREIISTLAAAAIVLIVLALLSLGSGGNDPAPPGKKTEEPWQVPETTPVRRVAHHPPPPLLLPELPQRPAGMGEQPLPPLPDYPDPVEPKPSTPLPDPARETNAPEAAPSDTPITVDPPDPAPIVPVQPQDTTTFDTIVNPAKIEPVSPSDPETSIVNGSEKPPPPVTSQPEGVDALNPLSAFKALELAQAEVPEKVKARVIRIEGEPHEKARTPWKWKVLFYDRDAKKRGRTVVVEGIVVTRQFEGTDDPVKKLLGFLGNYSSRDVMDMSQVKLDSKQAMGEALNLPELTNIILSKSAFVLEKGKSNEPTWLIKLYIPKSDDNKRLDFAGEVSVSARTGEVLSKKLKERVIGDFTEEVTELPPPALYAPEPASPQPPATP